MSHNNKIFILGGDLCLDDKKYIFSENILLIFDSSNFSILNLEAPILNNINVNKHSKAGPNIYQKNNVISILKKLNVKYLSGANNHLMDYGKEGIKYTKEILDKNKIIYGGFGLNINEARKEINLENSNISIICTCEEEFGVATKNHIGCYSMYAKDILRQIQALKKQKKFIVIYAHGGGEAIPLPSKYIIKRYKELIDNGADLIVGHHPHVPQGFEKYNNKYIFYSLGNFIHKNFKKDWGILLKIKINNYKIENYKIIPFNVIDYGVKIIKNNKKYFDYLKLLNNILANRDLYNSIYQEQAIYMYDNYYHRYFTGLFIIQKNIKQIIKNILNKILDKKIYKNSLKSKIKNDQLLLLHLIRNNSHKEFIETALKIKTNEINDLRNEKSKKIFNKLISFIKNEQ